MYGTLSRQGLMLAAPPTSGRSSRAVVTRLLTGTRIKAPSFLHELLEPHERDASETETKLKPDLFGSVVHLPWRPLLEGRDVGQEEKHAPFASAIALRRLHWAVPAAVHLPPSFWRYGD